MRVTCAAFDPPPVPASCPKCRRLVILAPTTVGPWPVDPGYWAHAELLARVRPGTAQVFAPAGYYGGQSHACPPPMSPARVGAMARQLLALADGDPEHESELAGALVKLVARNSQDEVDRVLDALGFLDLERRPDASCGVPGASGGEGVGRGS